MIIGITGWGASGKDTVGDYLVQKGFTRFSFSDYLREQLKKDNLEATRDNLRLKANELRRILGPAFISKEIISKIKQNPNQNWVLLSIRSTEEVKYLRKNCNFSLWCISVPTKIRYERAVKRARIGEESISYKTFCEKEKAERSTNNENSQEVDRVIEMADIIIENSGSEKELYDKIDETMTDLTIN